MYLCFSHKRLEFHAPNLGVVTRTAIWSIVTAEVTAQTWLHMTQWNFICASHSLFFPDALVHVGGIDFTDNEIGRVELVNE